jgi:CelD/BcsL family acetyltransferase involved in cellulose biosynthesis
MQIYRTDPLQDARWAKLVENHPRGSVFHTTGWLKALQQTYGYKPIVFTTSPPTGDLQNGLVFCRVRSWITGKRLVSLPFSDHCEPLFGNADELDFLITCLQAYMEHEDWRYLEVRPVNGNFNRKGIEAGFRTSKLYYLHSLDLRPDLRVIFRNLHKDSVQRRIRHATRMGLDCESGRSEKLLDDFYRLLLLTRSRHHLPPQPYAWFRNLILCMGDALELRVAYKQGSPIAGILTLRFRKTICYKYGCLDARYKSLGAVPLLLWRAIEDSKSTGAEEFDLGRSESENKGLVAFKDRWARGHARLMYWRYPASDALVSREGWRLRIAKRVFKWMPDRLLAATGKLIYPHIG